MDTARLIADIARETGIRLEQSDPILAAAVINERLLDASLDDLRKLVTRAADQLSAAGVQNEASARKVASDIINDAATWLEGRFKATGQEVTASMLAELRQETAKAEVASRIAVRAAWVVGLVGAGFLSLAAGYGVAALVG